MARRSRSRRRRHRAPGRLVPLAAGSSLMAPVTRYARSGEASIAYQVIGDGGLDLLFLTGRLTQLEQLWEAPANRRCLAHLAPFWGVILYDGGGTGLSDRVLVDYTVEQETQDALAVLDAAGSERAALLTYAQ